MARLDGEKKSLTPLIIGVALVAVLSAGAYYYFNTRDVIKEPPNVSPAQSVTVDGETSSAPKPVGTADTNSNTVSDNTALGNAVSGSQGSDTATSDNAVITGNTALEATPGATIGEAASNAMNAATAASATASTPSTDGGASNAATVNAAGGNISDKKDVVAKRSKTITHKDGTSVTYAKETHRDGSVTKNKIVTATATPPQ